MKDRRRALAVLVAVFLVGIVLGAAGSYYWLRPPVDTVRTFQDMRPPPPPKGPVRPKFPELNLTPEQKEKHAEIYAEAREKLKEINAENRKRMLEQVANLGKQEDAVWDQAYPKLIAVLNEEQKVKFDKFWEEARNYGHRLRRHRGLEPPKENRRKPERSQSMPPE